MDTIPQLISVSAAATSPTGFLYQCKMRTVLRSWWTNSVLSLFVCCSLNTIAWSSRSRLQLPIQRVADILQPDANRAGGITEPVKICAMAEVEGIPVVPHSNEAHKLHVIFSRAPHVCVVVEYFSDAEPDTGNEQFWKLFEGLLDANVDRTVMNDASGLGIQTRRDIIADFELRS